MLAGAVAVGAAAALPKIAKSEAWRSGAESESPELEGTIAPRDCHTVTPLGDGTALIAGGFMGTKASRSASLLDIRTGQVLQLRPMRSARARHAAILLSDGRVLVMGGFNGKHLSTVECFDPMSRTWSRMPNMKVPRADFAVVQSGGSIVIIGGSGVVRPAARTRYNLNTYR